MSKIKAIFFDRGNTTHNCLNGPPDYEKSRIRNNCMVEAINDTFSVSVRYEEVENMIINPWYETFKFRNVRGYEVSLEDFIKIFLLNRNIAFEDNNIKSIIVQYAIYHVIWDIPNDGIKELFRYLKKQGIFIGILSNSVMPGYVYRRIYKENNLDQYVDAYIFSYDVGIRKPDKKIFEYACRENSLNPNECIMIGDKIEQDIEGARQIGMRTILYNFENKSIDHKAEWEIFHFKEVKVILDEIS